MSDSLTPYHTNLSRFVVDMVVAKLGSTIEREGYIDKAREILLQCGVDPDAEYGVRIRIHH